jgi:hypothetical protein
MSGDVDPLAGDVTVGLEACTVGLQADFDPDDLMKLLGETLAVILDGAAEILVGVDLLEVDDHQRALRHG